MNKPVLALIALSMLPACPLLEAEVEVPEVCIASDDIHVGAAAAEVHERIVIDDLSEIHKLTDYAKNLRVRRAEVIAVSGIDNFDFVDTARIGISPGVEPAVTPLMLYQCNGNCDSRADSLALSDEEQTDVLDYLRGDAITLDLDITGDLPQVAWTMIVDVCFSSKATYEVTP